MRTTASIAELPLGRRYNNGPGQSRDLGFGPKKSKLRGWQHLAPKRQKDRHRGRSFSLAQGAGRGGTCPELSPLLAGRAAATVQLYTKKAIGSIVICQEPYLCQRWSADQDRFGLQPDAKAPLHAVTNVPGQGQHVGRSSSVERRQSQCVLARDGRPSLAVTPGKPGPFHQPSGRYLRTPLSGEPGHAGGEAREVPSPGPRPAPG